MFDSQPELSQLVLNRLRQIVTLGFEVVVVDLEKTMETVSDDQPAPKPID